MKPKNEHEEFVAELVIHLGDMVHEHEKNTNQLIVFKTLLDMGYGRSMYIELSEDKGPEDETI